MPKKLNQRLDEASSRLFVGRKAQINFFRSILESRQNDCSVLNILGPGGIGKTSLLFEFRKICSTKQITCTYLDARSIEPQPTSFLQALRESLMLEDTELVDEAMGADKKHVLMIDTFEWFAPLEHWLFSEFLGGLNATVLIVLSGRYPLQSIREQHPGWSALIKSVSLRNLSREESNSFLDRVGIPAEQHEPIYNFTHGHPLALSLVYEQFGLNADVNFEWSANPDFIRVLIERFLVEAPGPDYRLALEASALVKFTTEPLLAILLEEENEQSVFEWLRGLSFIESGPRGIFPHDLAREVLSSDLRWRNPDTFQKIHSHARTYYNQRLKQASLREQAHILTDYIFLHRENPVVKPFFEQLRRQWRGGGATTSVDLYSSEDRSVIEEMVMKNEGPDALKYVGYWLDEQPENVFVYKDGSGTVKGFLLSLLLDNDSHADLLVDPVVMACGEYLHKNAPLRSGEVALIFRFWMDREKHHAISRTQSQIFVQMVRQYLMTPRLAYSFLPIAYPDFYAMIFSYADLHRLKNLDFIENGISFGIFGHDWRKTPPAAWLEVLGSREVSSKPNQSYTENSDRNVLVLNRETFNQAAKDALRFYTRPQALLNNPLLQSRLIVDRLSGDESKEKRIQVLQALLTEGIESMQGTPRSKKKYRALNRTYIQPAASQEEAAEVLGLPYSTYRRHLRAGVQELTEFLWSLEVGS